MIQIFFEWLIPRPPPPHKKKQPKISLLIPFSSHSHAREDTFRWLLEYWKHELPEAEIVIGHSHGKIFSKGMALNDAASKAKGKVLVILDADAYMSGEVINTCADRILEELDHHLWYVPYRHLYRLTNGITKKIRKSDPSDPLRIPSPPPLEYIDGHSRDRSGYGHRFGAMIMIIPRQALDVLGCFDPRFKGWGCTDEKTEILTNTGWKTYLDVKEGDIALTLNHRSGMSEWQPIEKVNVFNVKSERLYSMESKNHSSLTTLNHKWAIIKRKGNNKYRFEISENFKSNDKIPIAAKCSNIPKEKIYSDALVEVMAWFWTEGHLKKRGGVGLCQSYKVNSSNCNRIKVALLEEFGESSHFWKRGKSKAKDIPRWREFIDPGNVMRISINKEGGDLLKKLAPNKVPSYQFLINLTQDQLELYIRTSLLADGKASGKDITKRDLGQRNIKHAEAFQFACILAGYGTSLTFGSDWNVHVKTSKNFYPRTCVKKYVEYTGDVWCPTTANSTWLARRNGRVYFTGNSEDIAFLRSLDTLYGLHKTTNNDVLHLWHPFFGQSYRTRVWKGQDASDGGSNNKLASEYNKATGHPSKMRKLVDEGCALIKQHRNKE